MATKVVRCREVGVDCDFEARGQNEDEILRQCADHARSAHGMTEIPAELAAKVRSAIHEE
jgi:predicted small metal-binding protein